jgi:energy-coupling factor transporter ATP-binding protein EcfA2
MTAIPLANYEKEQAAFSALFSPTCRQRILFLQGDSGSGKTTLIKTCLQHLPAGVDHVPIQLRGSQVNVAEIFFRAGDCLGWPLLPGFTAALDDQAARIQVSDNRQSGINNRINVVLQTGDPADRDHRRAALTEAWFGDLKRLAAPLLLVFDTYEQATAEMRQWLDGPFLTRAARADSLRVVVAGRSVPEANNIEWGHCCETHNLYGVPDAAAWLPVVEALGYRVPIDPPLTWLAGVCHALQGRPGEIIKVIRTLPRRETGQ